MAKMQRVQKITKLTGLTTREVIQRVTEIAAGVEASNVDDVLDCKEVANRSLATFDEILTQLMKEVDG